MTDDGSYPLGVTVKLRDEETHTHALTCPGAEPAGYGLGKAGVGARTPWRRRAPRARSCCATGLRKINPVIAPKKLIAELEAR